MVSVVYFMIVLWKLQSEHSARVCASTELPGGNERGDSANRDGGVEDFAGGGADPKVGRERGGGMATEEGGQKKRGESIIIMY